MPSALPRLIIRYASIPTQTPFGLFPEVAPLYASNLSKNNA